MNSIILPPVVLQKAAAPSRSDRYAHVDTEQVIELMKADGFTVEKVFVTRTRSNDPLYAKHMVDFRHPAMDPKGSLKRIEGTVARLLFQNAHDGTQSARFLRGVFRKVCSNGLVAPVNEGSVAIRHTGNAAAQVIREAQKMAKNTLPLFNAIERWSAIDLSPSRARNFARLAAVLRWGDPWRFEAEELLQVRRPDDDRGDLWSTFNRVQENATLGGLKGLSPSGRAATSRPLSEIGSHTDFQTGLWTLAEEFAKGNA